MLNVIAVVAALVAGLLAFAATRPATFVTQRSIDINAAPDKVLALINDFHRWTLWSPYEKYDSTMKRGYEGSASGKGAVYTWEGNNTAEFSAEPAGNATRLTWAIHGPSPFMRKLIGIFMNFDTLVGKDFEAGLASLKAEAEK